jgi:hypothetical protein
MTRSKTVWHDLADLQPHPFHQQTYRRPQDNSAYKDILASMKTRGYDEDKPLLITADRRILGGRTRWHAAKAAGLDKAPCIVFTPSSQETAELEYVTKICDENMYRIKTKVELAREQRGRLEAEKELARRRMGQGSDGGASKSADRVGSAYKVSGRTVTTRIKVLEGIEDAQAKGEHKKAERLTDLLERDKTGQALALIKGKKAAKKPSAISTDEHGNQGVINTSNLRPRTLAGAAKVNAFHQLPRPTQGPLLVLLGEIGSLSKPDYAFVLSWLKGHLPPTPKEALRLRTELELEASGTEADVLASDDDGGDDIKF